MSCDLTTKKPLFQLTHGHAKDKKHTRAYSTWHLMKQRCFNPKATGYARYGGKGISVCERWLIFENFLADMGEPPPNTTIDRIDNAGNYEPGNCRWATAVQQTENKNNVQRLTFQGKCQNIAAWARELGFPANTIVYRIRRGWSVEEALTTPRQKRANHRQKAAG